MVQLIIGHVTTHIAKIWVKGEDGSASASISLHDGFGSAFAMRVSLNKAEYDTGLATIAGLTPGTYYQCLVVFEKGSRAEGSLTTMPAAADKFNFLLASCHYSFGPDHVSPEFARIAHIAKDEGSLFQVNCGDQIYIDTAVRPFWVSSQEGYRNRYEDTWHSEPLKKVFGNLPQYMVIDDHEIFNDFSNDDLSSREQQWFGWAKNTYRIFQHSHNPDSPEDTLYYTFDCAHASFFVMDLRTEREGDRMISDAQFASLSAWINSGSPDQIKILVSSVPFITQLDGSQQKDKWLGVNYIRQRDQIIQVMQDSVNKKIVVLSGDIHLASHAWIEYESGGHTYRINELISSPIKQVQINLLMDETPAAIAVNGKQFPYFLGKHMGYPVTPGEQRYSLRNNIMSITVTHNTISYKVYAVNGNDMIFTDTISFES